MHKLCFMLPLLLGTVAIATELKKYRINKHFPEPEHKINASLDTGIHDIFETSEVKAKQDEKLVETDAVQDRKTPKGSKSKREKY